MEKKERKIFQNETFETISTKLCSNLFKLLDFHRKISMLRRRALILYKMTK